MNCFSILVRPNNQIDTNNIISLIIAEIISPWCAILKMATVPKNDKATQLKVGMPTDRIKVFIGSFVDVQTNQTLHIWRIIIIIKYIIIAQYGLYPK